MITIPDRSMIGAPRPIENNLGKMATNFLSLPIEPQVYVIVNVIL